MNKKKRHVVPGKIGLAIVVSVLLAGGLICMNQHKGKSGLRRTISTGTAMPGDSSMRGTGSASGDVRKDSAAADSVNGKTQLQPESVGATLQRPQRRSRKTAPIDSQAIPGAQRVSPEETENDTEDAAEDACAGDTSEPWVYTDPAGGLHHRTISVKLIATKPCAIEWKTDSGGPWKSYTGEDIRIEKTTALFIQAVDSCGNRMLARDERYELRPEDTVRYCPDDMEHVAVGGTSFCIDRFEWPNRKGRNPRTYVSVYQAMDTCASAGKRLCTSDEWTVACTGPYGWKYPYGAKFEIHACVVNDTTVRPAGEKPECRGYFDVFDMSGNCAEWTSTKSNRNAHFYNVMGGFWESGPQSGCFDVRYSYFPQNRHNPVGFRCCKDARPGGPQRGAE